MKPTRPKRLPSVRNDIRLTAVGLAVARALLYGNPSLAAPPVQLPVPCAAGACVGNSTPGFQTPAGFVTSGKATATQSGNQLTVQQTTNQAILNWSSFNIGAGGKVTFQQPGSSSVALNKIYQNSPSQIFGQLNANGQVYLLNPNGFVFGASSSVNVAGLVASSLGLTNGDSEFAAGLLSQMALQTPGTALSSDGRAVVTDATGNPVLDANGKPQTVSVSVQPGAQITAADGGRVLLAGQNVNNAGSITAPDGQIVLAAGQSVYLAASTDPGLRGLLVQVTNTSTTDSTVGNAINQTGGTLSAARGNVSLVGVAVNQSGRISATTSVNYNGSVVLTAGQGDANKDVCHGVAVCTTEGGQLVIGATSDIEVLPEYSDAATAAVVQTQIQSSVQLTGQKVFLEGGQIKAPGGNLTALAATNPSQGLTAISYDPGAELRVAAGTSIDLAGSNATVPMSANLVTIQLNSNELEDDPSQRTGPLKGQTIIADVRNGKPAIVSESSWQSVLQGIQENIAQRTSAGGTASFQSQGDVVVNPGTTINVSGGQWNYTGGIAQTSQLVGANGKSYEVSSADPNLSYVGVINPTYTQTYNGFGVQITHPTPGLARYIQGYTQGFSAGSVAFAAPAMSLQGTLVGTAVNGTYQRAAAPSESLIGYLAANGGNGLNGNGGIALGGTLIIGDGSGGSAVNGLPNRFAPAVTFAASASPVVVADGAPLPPQTLQLTTSYITNGGFSQTEIFSDSTVTLPAGMPLNLGAGGGLEVIASRINVGSNITALGGTIDLRSEDSIVNNAANLPRLGIDIGAGVTLDVSGQWTNDSVYAGGTNAGPTSQNGGKISLSLLGVNTSTPGGELVLGDGVDLLANGGAWLKANGTITGGAGGSITLDASAYQSALEIGNSVGLSAFGTQGAKGGSFALLAPAIEVVQGTGSWTGAQSVDWLPPPTSTDPTQPPADPTQPALTTPTPVSMFQVGAGLFSKYGFSNVSLTASDPIQYGDASTTLLKVAAGTSINAQAESLQLLSGFQTRHSGGTVQSFTRPTLLNPVNRNPYAINLTVQPVGAAPPTTVASYGDLVVEAGSSIVADPLSSIAFKSEGSIHIDGVIRAPGGSISAQIVNPTTNLDYGFLPSQTLELGSTGVLDVSGATVMTPNTQGLLLGEVLPGGTVTLTAKRGSVVTDAGSSIDIAGGSALLDEQNLGGSGGYTRATMGSSAGELSVDSGEAISLLGKLSAAAGVSSEGPLEGGTLNVTLNQADIVGGSISPTGYQPFPQSPVPTIELVSSTAGSSPTAAYGNEAILGILQLEQSGIDVLNLRAAGANGPIPTGVIAIDTNSALSMGREIVLDAPYISVGYGIDAALSAPYVSLTDTNPIAVAGSITSLGGTGELNITASQIALSGVMAFQGIGNTTFTSAGDIELQPLISSAVGELALNGNLTLNASRIYPATYASYTISDPNGNVTIGQTAASPGTPLSAGGSLTITANNIVSSGTILAPFGTIDLEGTTSVELKSGSVTSVSADGAVIPYGQTVLNQAEWLVGLAPDTSGLSAPPVGQVTLRGANVSLDSGAKVDLSGGGDLSAYEWVPGTGGSIDVLNTTPGLYAIVPALGGAYAAYDLQRFNATSASLGAGSSVYLSGIAGLPAGTYTLLPASYALTFKNSYLVQVESGYASLTPGTIGHLTNGTPVVAGYETFGNTGLRASSGYEGFAIYPGSYGQTLAQYDVNNASSYFSNAAAAAAAAGKPRIGLPADAGTLLIQAGTSLSALGTVNSAAGTGGTAATIEISADNLTVTHNVSDTVADGVAISASVLQSWNAGSIVLGGQYVTDSTGAQSLEVTADSVTFAQGAQFSANQVIAVANSSIDVQSGAVVASTSGLGGPAPTTAPVATMLTLSGTNPSGAALLSVSDTNLILANRGDPTVAGAPPATAATVNVELGAALDTRGAVSLDAPSSIKVDGNINAAGASWSLASNSIAFTGAGSASNDTLQIGAGLLSQMQSARSVRLNSAGAIDFLTSVALGSPATMNGLSLTATALNNCDGCSIALGADTLTLAGVGKSGAAATAGTGNLTLTANTLNLGGAALIAGATTPTSVTTGDLALNGNAQTTIQVSGAVVGQGTNTKNVNTVAFSGDVSIAAAELTAASESGTNIVLPNGTLTISSSGPAAAASTLASSLGGRLALTANAISDTGSIIVPGGTVSLAATGNVNIGSGATVDTSGITVTVGTQTEGAAGGTVNISAGGDLALASGATINVSGGGNAPAGSVALVGVGDVSVDATLLGKAVSGVTGGSFSLDAGSLAGGLAPLANNLTSGGFNNQIGVEVHAGDLELADGQKLTANNITLAADSGAVNISGALTGLAGGQSGFIGLYGGTGVSLLSSAVLTANGIESAGHGGEIELSSTCLTCSVNFAAGSSVVTNGGTDGGELVVAAPMLYANGAASDVAINVPQGGLNVKAGKVIIDAVVPTFMETRATIAQNLQADVDSAANDLTNASANISGRLNPTGSSSIGVHAGVEIDDANAGETLVLPALDLTAYSSPFNGATPRVVDLTVRAAGGLTIGGNITDGYDANNSALYTAGSDSASLRFVAGADLTSANPLSTAFVSPGGPGAILTVGTPAVGAVKAKAALVTTGTGNIELASSGNVNFVLGSSVFTTGTQAAPTVTAGTASVPVSIDFPEGGGNVIVQAGQDIVATLPSDDISVSFWEARNATDPSLSDSNTSLGQWGINLAAFKQHPWAAATFGGGDISISAGRDISQLTTAAADSSYISGGSTPTQTLLPGGGLTVAAGRDIANAQFFAADGSATIDAGRSFTTVTGTSGGPIGSIFYLQNAQISVFAQDDINVNGIFNPTIAFQSAAAPAFWTYGENSSFSAESAGGDINVVNSSAGLPYRQIAGLTIAAGSTAVFQNRLVVMPSNLRLVSLSQDISVGGTLFPSSSGQLELFAGKDISGTAYLSDAPASVLSTPSNVLTGGVSIAGGLGQMYDFFGDLHANDPTPASVVAGEDINSFTLSVPKAADIEAGRDILNLTYFGQNLNPNDLTLISAGRDFKDVTTYGSDGSPTPPSSRVQVGGPGSLVVLAGRDVDLGFGGGIITVGNLQNANLPTSDGASITIAAGLGDNLDDPNYAAFYQQVIAPSSTYQQQLVSYVESLTGTSGLSTKDADADFEAFTTLQQQSFINKVFFQELSLSGTEANQPHGNYKRGYDAIDALFPGSRTGTPGNGNTTYSGNLNLTYSQIYTESGGDITLLVPGGTINVGLASPPAVSNLKSPSQLGIVAEGAGDVNIYSKSDVNVDSSRIFTLGGGDITIWSDEGNIDAGKGSKTSLSAPPPTYSIDAQGNVLTTFGAAVAGSGIRTIQTNPEQPLGNVNLIAPAGFVDAGEAGIGAAGSINIAALSVLNAANINYGGTATGVPPLVSGITASLASAASAASSATTSVTQSMDAGASKEAAAPLAQQAISWLDVFVSGLGEENCKPEDIECLKRQKQE